jgi:hypothetical protein
LAPLPSNLRRELERAIIRARELAEQGSREAIEALTVHEGKRGAHVTSEADSVRDELRRLEREEKELRRQLVEIAKRQEPMTRISEDAKAFIRTWQDVGEILDAATHEERLLILRHYVEVIELHSTDPKGTTGTYAIRLFPEVRPDRGFDLGNSDPSSGPDDESPCPEMTNGDGSLVGDDPALLTDSRLVRVIDEKAPRIGLETATRWLTALCPAGDCRLGEGGLDATLKDS